MLVLPRPLHRCLNGLRHFSPARKLNGTFQQLLPLLAHLDRVHRMISGDLLESVATTDRLRVDLPQAEAFG